jgi:hypothetical protein
VETSVPSRVSVVGVVDATYFGTRLSAATAGSRWSAAAQVAAKHEGSSRNS